MQLLPPTLPGNVHCKIKQQQLQRRSYFCRRPSELSYYYYNNTWLWIVQEERKLRSIEWPKWHFENEFYCTFINTSMQSKCSLLFAALIRRRALINKHWLIGGTSIQWRVIRKPRLDSSFYYSTTFTSFFSSSFVLSSKLATRSQVSYLSTSVCVCQSRSSFVLLGKPITRIIRQKQTVIHHVSHIITVFVEYQQSDHQCKQMRDKEVEEEDAPIPRGKDNVIGLGRTDRQTGGASLVRAAAIDEREVCLTNRKVLLCWG